MNAAEITDKLGLHSLRQRAWVMLSVSIRLLGAGADRFVVYSIYVCHFR